MTPLWAAIRTRFLYKAVEAKNADGSQSVPIVQTGEFGVNLGRFDLTLKKSEKGWKLTGLPV